MLPTLVGGDYGFSIGAEANITQTFSGTIGDVARGIAWMFHGDGGPIQYNGTCECF